MCNNATNFFCWMTCMDIPKVDQAELYVEAGYSLYCVDETIMASSNNDVTRANEACSTTHNSACRGAWEKTVDGVPGVEIVATADRTDIDYPFCYGGTTMYMDGFHWIQSSTCVVLLVPSWILNSATKYAAAVIGTVLVAIGLEKFIQQRRKTMAYMKSGTKRLVVSAAFYGVQLTVGYMLMLVIMVYSGILFLAVILGLVCGHVMFNAKDAIWPIHESSNLGDMITEADGEGSDTGVNMGEMDSKNTSDHDEYESNSTSERHSNCCNGGHHSANLLRSDSEEERAIREGSTFCQEFGGRTSGYYGSMEGTTCTEAEMEVGIKKTRIEVPRIKVIDHEVPEGSTPCCQHGL